METYRADFPKYAAKSQHKNVQLFFDKAPGLVTKPFKYSHVSSEQTSTVLKTALNQLEWAGLIQKIIATSASGIPLSSHAKDNKFKLIFLDIGLTNCADKLDFQRAWNAQLHQINAGALAEQFVGQELLANADPHLRSRLYYWERDKKGAMAEVDYVIQSGSNVIPIDVKAGTTGTLKSLQQFLLEKEAPFGVRISQHPLSFHDNILSVPFYLMHRLPAFIQGGLNLVKSDNIDDRFKKLDS